MAKFITRVELHDARSDDYEVLHASMKAEGFERTITASDGTTYHMPTAEYFRQDNTATRMDVLEAAKRAATKTQKTCGVIVTEAVASTWWGLPLVG
jgi:hypothetical protein